MDIGAVTNLGVAAFSIYIMWLMYKSAAQERKANESRMDSKDLDFRKLEKEVRTEIIVQLAASTTALRDNAKVMERLISQKH
jgi:hypothetical protein